MTAGETPQNPQPESRQAMRVSAALDWIHPAASSASLLGRAWYLYRSRWRTCLKVTGILMLMFLTQGLLISLTQALPSAAGLLGAWTAVILAAASGISTIVLSLLSAYMMGLLGCVLSRFFCSAILLRQPLPLKACFAHIQRYWLTATGIMLLGVIVFAAATLMDMMALGVGVLGAVILATLYALDNTIVSAGTTVTIVLWGSLMLIVLLGIVSIQMLLFWMPLVTLSNADLCFSDVSLGLTTGAQADIGALNPYAELRLDLKAVGIRALPISITQVFGYTFRLLFANLPKAFLFGLMLFVFTMVISLVLQMPMNLWMMFEYMRQAFQSQGVPGTMPFHVIVLAHMWSSLIPGLLHPFTVGAMTLFWYDCKVVKEAFDLRLWLATLRQKHLPTDGPNQAFDISPGGSTAG